MMQTPVVLPFVSGHQRAAAPGVPGRRHGRHHTEKTPPGHAIINCNMRLYINCKLHLYQAG
jgi:hypothetical protein